jgi:hypothetical protein
MGMSQFLQLRNQIRHPMKKQTAVEWLIENIGEYFPNEIGGVELLVKKAKAMEKEQMIDFVIKIPMDLSIDEDGNPTVKYNPKQY